MEYNFNNDQSSPPGLQSRTAISGLDSSTENTATSTPAPTSAAASAPASIGHTRFNSCRWQQPIEDGNAAFCTHREVKPYAGTAGFDPDAWCGECQYYKLRRAPKKRTPNDEYSY